jgi:hypothetical protein
MKRELPPRLRLDILAYNALAQQDTVLERQLPRCGCWSPPTGGPRSTGCQRGWGSSRAEGSEPIHS